MRNHLGVYHYLAGFGVADILPNSIRDHQYLDLLVWVGILAIDHRPHHLVYDIGSDSSGIEYRYILAPISHALE